MALRPLPHSTFVFVILCSLVPGILVFTSCQACGQGGRAGQGSTTQQARRQGRAAGCVAEGDAQASPDCPPTLADMSQQQGPSPALAALLPHRLCTPATSPRCPPPCLINRSTGRGAVQVRLAGGRVCRTECKGAKLVDPGGPASSADKQAPSEQQRQQGPHGEQLVRSRAAALAAAGACRNMRLAKQQTPQASCAQDLPAPQCRPHWWQHVAWRCRQRPPQRSGWWQHPCQCPCLNSEGEDHGGGGGACKWAQTVDAAQAATGTVDRCLQAPLACSGPYLCRHQQRPVRWCRCQGE